jgi:hypothetical protein
MVHNSRIRVCGGAVEVFVAVVSIVVVASAVAAVSVAAAVAAVEAASVVVALVASALALVVLALASVLFKKKICFIKKVPLRRLVPQGHFFTMFIILDKKSYIN